MFLVHILLSRLKENSRRRIKYCILSEGYFWSEKDVTHKKKKEEREGPF